MERKHILEYFEKKCFGDRRRCIVSDRKERKMCWKKLAEYYRIHPNKLKKFSGITGYFAVEGKDCIFVFGVDNGIIAKGYPGQGKHIMEYCVSNIDVDICNGEYMIGILCKSSEANVCGDCATETVIHSDRCYIHNTLCTIRDIRWWLIME